MDLSIIIVSYNTLEVTSRCIETIIEETCHITYEVIVVDNASTDGSASYIASRYSSVTVIRNEENIGFGPAQNMGILQSVGEYVMILNSDAFLVSNAGKRLVEFLKHASKDVGVVGPQILNPDLSVAPSARRMSLTPLTLLVRVLNRYTAFGRLVPQKWLRARFGSKLARVHDNFAAHDRMREVDYVDGMCVVVRRDVFRATGLFDEQFFFDSEILDLSQRVRKGGWKIVFCPEAKVIHLLHASRRKVSRILVETQRSELAYCAKYNPEYLTYLCRLVLATVICVKLAERVRGILRKGGGERHRIYSEIIDICRRFRPEHAWMKEKIARLP